MNRKTDLLLNWRFMTSYPGWAYVSLGRNFVLLTYLRHRRNRLNDDMFETLLLLKKNKAN